jgi:hypothetical protein
VTYRIADLSAEVLNGTDAVIVTRVVDQRQALALRGLAPPVGTASEWLHTLASLAIDEALLLPGAQESGDRPTRFRVAPRMTSHVRHRQKYSEVPTGQRARTLADLGSLLPSLPDDVFRSHLIRGDFHRWTERVFGDVELGDAIRRAERLEATQALETVLQAISDRYGERSS